MTARYDVVVWGITGFTGRRVAQVLAAKQAAGETLRWAGAGRDATKVRSFLTEARATPEVGVIVADVTKPEQLDAMCAQAKVVIACAGPFTLVGMPVAEACVRNGAHYIDITGEPNYVRSVVETLHDRAQAAGVAVIPCCGFDSVPSDLANWAVHKAAERSGDRLSHVETFFRSSGGASRGTLDSVLQVFAHGKPADFHPLALVPKADRKGIAPSPMKKGLWYNSTLKSWTAPFMMASINEKVVRRTNYLSGRTASYTEGANSSFIGCIILTLVLYLTGLFLIPAVRNFAVRFFPAARDGPSEAQIAKSFFTVTALGHSATGKQTVIAKVKGAKGIDGYKGTSIMASEVALALAKGEFNSGSTAARGGVLTPAFAVGEALIKRLPANGIVVSDV